MQLQTTSNASQKWSLVLARDGRADGRFVYGVKSTGVFCRPSCPSRKPRRENVEFFDSPAQAQQAGYRGCRRCLPTERNPQAQKIEAACRYIDENLEVTLSLTAISRHVAISPFHFQRLFKRILGISPRQYQQARRAGKFRQALLTEGRVTDAIYEAGYSSSSRAYESIPAQLGMTPSAFRRKGEGVEIRYTVLETELGRLLIATTERGVCSVRFGNNEAALLREFKRDFEAAEIQRDDKALEPVTAQMKQWLNGPSAPLNFSLDIQGTAFQQMVWEALRRIPSGETRSYAQVAESIGRPEAVRAVANACASNPVALVVPCHRVVHKNGRASGYRWGVKRKAALLEKEHSTVSKQ
ncbi:MAG TPA: bifunctional DNA-binding transcriptional regulator/O6-methylguanine-DNA methyltransferase Ada [Candidatus Sulfotelmatobacter sp.]|nr:bifunctional DNA-binding transcriptional regulator/O6-methylguanine-DNA methyltransferase Ada [Candidatus Sulfotelmatobacter sp.]